MQAREWRTLDRKTWGSGEWDNEPDKKQWQDPATGLPCLIVRHPISGHLSGYVGVHPGHPFHGVGRYDDNGKRVNEERFDELRDQLDVHCGVNCATGCNRWPEEDGGIAVGICHEVEPGEVDDVWWVGFDCMHAGHDAWPTSDLTAYLERLGVPIVPPLPPMPPGYEGEYRNFAFVEAQCASLAGQLVGMQAAMEASHG